MATYLEDPVWQRVQEDITRREYGKIQARERSQRLELHWNREFELLKPKVEDAVVKALTVQRKLIEQLGGVCGSIFPRLLYVYGEQWTESLSQGILTGRQPLSREIQKYQSQTWYLRHGSVMLECCQKIENCYKDLNKIIIGMEPNRGCFLRDRRLHNTRDSDYIIPEGLQSCRWSIESRFDTSLNYLARLKCVLDKSQGNSDSCRNDGDYVHIVSREFCKDVGGGEYTGLDWQYSDWSFRTPGQALSAWIFSELGSCQEEPQIPQLTNSSKETGDEHSSERLNAGQAATAAATRDQTFARDSTTEDRVEGGIVA